MVALWPQIVMIALLALGWGISLVKHGEEAVIHFGYRTLSIIITVTLLYFGGFWS
jgi:hypothetical protein